MWSRSSWPWGLSWYSFAWWSWCWLMAYKWQLINYSAKLNTLSWLKGWLNTLLAHADGHLIRAAYAAHADDFHHEDGDAFSALIWSSFWISVAQTMPVMNTWTHWCFFQSKWCITVCYENLIQKNSSNWSSNFQLLIVEWHQWWWCLVGPCRDGNAIVLHLVKAQILSFGWSNYFLVNDWILN